MIEYYLLFRTAKRSLVECRVVMSILLGFDLGRPDTRLFLFTYFLCEEFPGTSRKKTKSRVRNVLLMYTYIVHTFIYIYSKRCFISLYSDPLYIASKIATTKYDEHRRISYLILSIQRIR